MSTQMSEAVYPTEVSVRQLGINVRADEVLLGLPLTARFATLDNGETSQHVTDGTEGGTDYMFSKLNYYDYYRESTRPLASRMIATLLQGKRTELAYWTQAAPDMELTVHQGVGRMVIGTPPEDSSAAAHDTKIKHLHRTAALGALANVTLPSGKFYSLEAALWTPKPFVISGLYEGGAEVDWDAVEKHFAPGQESVEAPEGIIKVPQDFTERYS